MQYELIYVILFFAFIKYLYFFISTILSTSSFNTHTCSNGSSKVSGGAIRSELGSNVCIEDSRFKKNNAGISGGGIYSKGELQLINSVFEENKANVVRMFRR